jgi:hypothetical protein
MPKNQPLSRKSTSESQFQLSQSSAKFCPGKPKFFFKKSFHQFSGVPLEFPGIPLDFFSSQLVQKFEKLIRPEVSIPKMTPPC